MKLNFYLCAEQKTNIMSNPINKLGKHKNNIKLKNIGLRMGLHYSAICSAIADDSKNYKRGIPKKNLEKFLNFLSEALPVLDTLETIIKKYEVCDKLKKNDTPKKAK